MGLITRRMVGRWMLLAVLTLAACSVQPAVRDNITATQPGATVAVPAVPRENFVNAHAIIIVRHADIDVAAKARQGNATPLLDRGQERAKELITALKDAGVSRIVTTGALRTQETAVPLAAELKIVAEDPSERGTSAAAFVRYLAETAK